MIKKSIVEVNIELYQLYQALRIEMRRKYKLELGKWETYKSRACDVIFVHKEIMKYHLAIFYNIGDRKFVEKCHSLPIIKVWHPLG